LPIPNQKHKTFFSQNEKLLSRPTRADQKMGAGVYGHHRNRNVAGFLLTNTALIKLNDLID
jgi:hypothetical protein